jgi:hypothetical protein
MLRVMSESNFYPSMAQLYMDLSAFGSACAIIYEDFDDVIRCYNPCAGEYYFANSSKGKVDRGPRVHHDPPPDGAGVRKGGPQ